MPELTTRTERPDALVLEPATKQVDLLAEAELRDRPVRLATDTVVGVPGRRLDLVAPLRPQHGELALETALRIAVGESGSLGEVHDGIAERGLGPGPT